VAGLALATRPHGPGTEIEEHQSPDRHLRLT
jgi:hypothetical protein